MKQLKLVIAGMTLAVVLGSGFFDEAGQAKVAHTGWCVGVCQQ